MNMCPTCGKNSAAIEILSTVPYERPRRSDKGVLIPAKPELFDLIDKSNNFLVAVAEPEERLPDIWELYLKIRPQTRAGWMPWLIKFVGSRNYYPSGRTKLGSYKMHEKLETVWLPPELFKEIAEPGKYARLLFDHAFMEVVKKKAAKERELERKRKAREKVKKSTKKVKKALEKLGKTGQRAAIAGTKLKEKLIEKDGEG